MVVLLVSVGGSGSGHIVGNSGSRNRGLVGSYIAVDVVSIVAERETGAEKKKDGMTVSCRTGLPDGFCGAKDRGAEGRGAQGN